MKKFIRSSVMTGLLFAMAVVLLTVGTIGGTQAALQEFSEDWVSSINLDHIGVTLTENGNPVSWRNYGTKAESGFGDEKQDGNLIETMLATQQVDDVDGKTQLKVGRPYEFRLAVTNTGTINEYVRVTIYRYWVNVNETVDDYGWFHGNGSSKIVDKQFDPGLIDISFTGSGWIADPANELTSSGNTPASERLVYYYNQVIPKQVKDANGKTQFFSSSDLTDFLTIKPGVLDVVEKSVETVGNKTVTTYTYVYDNVGFVVRAEVDAVQTHHWQDAMASAWGLTDQSVITQIQPPPAEE